MSDENVPIDANVPPPVAARPVEEEEDPVRELTRLAERLARTQNRKLLVQYLKCRRNLR